ncbi:MAG: hypothetical protein EPN79_02070 [Burkholderiaceae bacterium]|nr:MAG: hypothetical protein EPN79_02070 [Burkholderiaceae bacterium]TBR76176.1 MAG: hypothetical protein EPN64_09205 [Burkholderiaceae bacterium]
MSMRHTPVARLTSAQRFVIVAVAQRDNSTLMRPNYARTRYALQDKGLIEVNETGSYALTAAGKEARERIKQSLETSRSTRPERA